MPRPALPRRPPHRPVPLRWIIASTALVAALAAPPAPAQVAAAERWQLQDQQAAPWGPALGVAPGAGLALRLGPHSLHGPAPLACTHARHRFMRQPVDGWFEGLLPPPAEASARALGLPVQGLVTQRIACANASIDLLRSADGQAWLGLDNRVLHLQRLQAGDTTRRSPEAAVQALLLHHLATDQGVSAAHVAALAPWLTPGLVHRLERWLARSATADEPPELNGDPFTNTQEPPDAFELAAARVQGRQATLAVSFFGPAQARSRVHLVLVRGGGGWQVDDVRYPDGVRLAQLLGR